jgi:hypothetical protein
LIKQSNTGKNIGGNIEAQRLLMRLAAIMEAVYGAKETDGTSSETNTRMKQGAYKSFSHNGPSDGLR